MANVASASLARQLGSLFEGGSAAGLSDRQLIERFAASRDEAAFAALVDRHGPLVLGVCRQLLGNGHDAEDAFQAVFLVLARKAGSLREPELLGNWLYGVALRTARKARLRLARRRQTEEEGAVRRPEAAPAAPAEGALLDREQSEALHGEIDRLPGAFRAPLVLCYFEGLTLDEAAHRLRWPVGTLRSRLARARDKLRTGLARRGFVLPAAALGAALVPRSASASVPPLLCSSTTRAAIRFAAGHAVGGGASSAPAAALAQEVARTMIVHKLRAAALSFCLLATIATVVGSLIPALDALAGSREGPPIAQEARREPRPPDSSPAPGRMLVVGRVLDPEGKPVPDASVMVYGAPRQGGDVLRSALGGPAILGRAAGDASGRFRLEMPRISSATHHEVGVTTLAPGHGVGWAALDADAERPEVAIALRPEQIIEGRLFDINGRPAEGVRVAVLDMGTPRRGPEVLPSQVDGPGFDLGLQADDRPAWPRPATTGPDGRFTIRGVGRDLRVILMAEAPRFARQMIVVDADAVSKPITEAMQPAQVMTGRVTYADTGQPVPHTIVSIWAYRGGPAYASEFETDAEGYYRANPFATDRYAVSAGVPEGQPYLGAGTEIFPWPKGAIEHRVDLALKRGTILRGKVTEEGTGRPIAGAALGYAYRNSGGGVPATRARSKADGSYVLAVLPQPETLAVMGPTDDYVFRVMGRRMLDEGRPGGGRQYAHAFVACDLKPGTESREVDVTLRRGATVAARVVRPDGQPAREARVFTRLLLAPQPWATRMFWLGFHGDVRDGRCELHGLPPDEEVPVFFLDPKDQVGAVASISAGAAKDGPIAVRLEPCGMAMARLVDPKGRPLAGYRDPFIMAMVVTPGPDRQTGAAAEKEQLAADQDYLSRIDPDHHTDLASDDQGRITFPALIPGASYRVFDRTAGNGDRVIRKEFVAGSGVAIELGDIVIEKPES
jgi:RNA polymerase sigma factor (sigma-70 family)